MLELIIAQSDIHSILTEMRYNLPSNKYDVGQKVISELCSKLVEKITANHFTSKLNIPVIPGNHDVDPDCLFKFPTGDIPLEVKVAMGGKGCRWRGGGLSNRSSDYLLFARNRESTEFFVYPWLNGDPNVGNFNSILANRIDNMLTQNGLTLNDCVQNSVETQWYVDLRIGGELLIKEPFYIGYGYTDVPTLQMWRIALFDNLSLLYDYGFTYEIDGNILKIESLPCTERNIDELLTLNVGIQININCNSN